MKSRAMSNVGAISTVVLVALASVSGCSSIGTDEASGEPSFEGDNGKASGSDAGSPSNGSSGAAGAYSSGAAGSSNPGSAGAAGQMPDEPPPPDAGADVAPDAACDLTKAAVLYLSADDSNSMAGAPVARSLIQQGQLVYKGLRTYEFLNYYSFDYPPAPPGQVAVSAQAHVNADGTYNMQIGVRAPDESALQRRSFNLTLSVDTSSSMKWGPPGNTAMDRVKEACRSLAGQLRQGDVVSIVTWNHAQALLLDSLPVQLPGDPALLAKCELLQPYGASDLGAGLDMSYKVARKNFDPSKINRVVMLSDGGANVSSDTRTLIKNAAQDSQGEAIYLMGAGVGDPWNYNDQVMDLVTDAGRGAYVFLDSTQEAQKMFGPRLLANLEVAARNVRVEVTLPPTFVIEEFHGEQVSANPEEVDPQHLATGDAMVFHQVLRSCAPEAVDGSAPVKVKVSYEEPISREPRTAEMITTLAELLAGDTKLLLKGDAVVAFAEALKDVRGAKAPAALAALDKAQAEVQKANLVLGGDPELEELRGLLQTYRGRFDGTGESPVVPNPQPANPILPDCAACSSSEPLEQLRCAADLCDNHSFLGQSYSSPTTTSTAGTFAAMQRFGASSNDLAPQFGGSYAVMATGPATGTSHSVQLGSVSGTDKFASDSQTPIFDAMEWTIRLKAPPNANGFSVRYVYFSEEYDDFIGTQYNDKFYMLVKAGSTNSGSPTVINFAACRDPESYYDFVCGQGMQHCNPGQRYCYVAINTAMSECCWHGGCPNGGARTDITGTGFECASDQSSDSAARGSSTGWLETQWPIEPNEEFELTFHIHDSGDGIFDSAVILDRVVFLDNAVPGTLQP